MTISVVVPAYNAAATIRATLDSALGQTLPADEILVLDDGSTDDTYEILRSYGSRIAAFRQANAGVGGALSALCARARGDLVAILGSDDIWHARYLEIQQQLFEENADAVALFTAHVDFFGTDGFEWTVDPLGVQSATEVIPLSTFIRRYNVAPGPFANMSHCCIPRRIFQALGPEPFRLRMAEDLYFFNLLGLSVSGPVVYTSAPLVAYRVREGSLSWNRLTLNEAEVQAFELLEGFVSRSPDGQLANGFAEGFAIKRRQYAKTLLRAGRIREARKQLRASLNKSRAKSAAKSLALLFLSYLPKTLQPAWPSLLREWKRLDQR